VCEIQSIEIVETIGTRAMFGGKFTVGDRAIDFDGADFLFGQRCGGSILFG